MAQERDLCVTIRPPRTDGFGRCEKPAKVLVEELGRSPVRGYQHLRVSAAPNRQERVAKIATRSAEVTLESPRRQGSESQTGRFYAVMAREEGTAQVVSDRSNGCCSQHGRSEMWPTHGPSLMDTHSAGHRRVPRTWKSERATSRRHNSGLVTTSSDGRRSSAAVATRIQRSPSLHEPSPSSGDGRALARGDRCDHHHEEQEEEQIPTGETPTIAEAVTWVAEIGGYNRQVVGRATRGHGYLEGVESHPTSCRVPGIRGST